MPVPAEYTSLLRPRPVPVPSPERQRAGSMLKNLVTIISGSEDAPPGMSPAEQQALRIQAERLIATIAARMVARRFPAISREELLRVWSIGVALRRRWLLAQRRAALANQMR